MPWERAPDFSVLALEVVYAGDDRYTCEDPSVPLRDEFRIDAREHWIATRLSIKWTEVYLEKCRFSHEQSRWSTGWQFGEDIGVMSHVYRGLTQNDEEPH